MNNRNDIIKVEDARIMFPNFSGVARQYNDEGNRNFCIALTPELYDLLVARDVSIRVRPPRDEYDEPLYLLRVKVNMESNYPPQIYLRTGHTMRKLTAETLCEVDAAFGSGNVICSDVTFRLYKSNRYPNAKGPTAYLQTAVFVIDEDPLLAKYRDMDANFDDPFPGE